MTTNDAVYISSQGVVYYNGIGAFSGVDGNTSGFVLTSNGTGVAPSFQMSSTPFSPAGNVQLFDDFASQISGNIITGTLFSQLAWNFPPASSSAWTGDTTNVTSSHPGMIIGGQIDGGNTENYLISGSETSDFILGGGALTVNWVIDILTLSTGPNNYTLRIGMGDTTGADQANGIYFEYNSGTNAGNWVLKTASASTRTSTNTATAAATGFHNFQISVNAAATSVSYSIDGVSLGTINTHIPATAIGAMVDILRTAGTIATNISIDLFYLNQTLTSPR